MKCQSTYLVAQKLFRLLQLLTKTGEHGFKISLANAALRRIVILKLRLIVGAVLTLTATVFALLTCVKRMRCG